MGDVLISLLSEGVGSEETDSAEFSDFVEDVEVLWDIDEIEHEIKLLTSMGIPLYWLRGNLKAILDKTPSDFEHLDESSQELLEMANVDWLLSLAPRVQSDLQIAFWGLSSKIKIDFPTSLPEGRVKNLIFLSLLSTYIHKIYTFEDFLNQHPVSDFLQLTIGLNEPFLLVPMFEEFTFLSFEDFDLQDDSMRSQSRNLPPQGIKVFYKEDGLPLDSDLDRPLWKEVRRNSVSATDARKLVKLNGQASSQREKLLEDKLAGDSLPFFDAFELGIKREPEIAKIVQELFPEESFIHNRYLAVGENPRHVATPDMVGGSSLCEIKVSTKPLKSTKTTYRDQLQWQLHVTGYEKVLFVVENRYSGDLEYEWIFRDRTRISTLVQFADLFLVDLDAQKSSDDWMSEEFYDDDYEIENVPYEYAINRTVQVETSVTDYSDHFDDLPIVNLLSKGETKEALTLYGQGLSIYQIASEISRPSNDIIGTFGVHFYGLDEDLVNPMAKKFRHGWTPDEMTKLSKLFLAGESVDDICASLGRDRLGVLYKVFMTYNPEIPKALAKSFKIKG
jgi:hypothetical protein